MYFSHEQMCSRQGQRDVPTRWSATASNGMIATAHYLATEAGARILAQGGNAIDAAVAASLALGVCEPAESGLGGMAMMLLYTAESANVVVLEGACHAPKLASIGQIAACDRYRGYSAVAVPRYLAVIEYALSHYGTLPLKETIAPAIRLAEHGYPVTHLQHKMTARYQKILADNTAGRFFLGANGKLLPRGSWFRQPILARTLRRLDEVGLRDFYRGGIAQEIVDDMMRHGGYLRAEDLAEAQWITETKPLAAQFLAADLLTMHPPGGGVALIEMLNLFAAMRGSKFDPDNPTSAALFAAIIRKTRADRKKYSVKVGAESIGRAADLLSEGYARTAAHRIASSLAPDGGTSHISVMDRHGNAVSLTQSIDRDFGAAVVSPELGFLYNDYMNTFNLHNSRHPNYLRPGAKARSNAAPSLLLKNGKPWIAVGCAGSARIPSAMFQVLVRLNTQSPFQAVNAPRLHCTSNGSVLLEAERFPIQSLEALERNGFRLTRRGPYSHTMGGLQLVIHEADVFCGVADPRRDGAASGPVSGDKPQI